MCVGPNQTTEGLKRPVRPGERPHTATAPNEIAGINESERSASLRRTMRNRLAPGELLSRWLSLPLQV